MGFSGLENEESFRTAGTRRSSTQRREERASSANYQAITSHKTHVPIATELTVSVSLISQPSDLILLLREPLSLSCSLLYALLQSSE